MSNEFDVLVVGAGPVGLWVACELALANVNVAVLERRAESVTQSRALAIQGRTLEVFALRGLADRFLSRGRPIPKGHFGGLGTALDFSVFHTRFPFTLFLPQATTEALLEERALELGVEIRRGHFVETAKPCTDGVVLEGQNGEASFRFFARYVVGADGARSMMRRAAGIDFAGHPAQHAFMLAEVVLDAPPHSHWSRWSTKLVPCLWRPAATAYITGSSWMHPWPWHPPSLYRSLNWRPPRRASQGQIFARAIRSDLHASPTKRGSRSTIGRAALSSLAMLPISMRQWVARA